MKPGKPHLILTADSDRSDTSRPEILLVRIRVRPAAALNVVQDRPPHWHHNALGHMPMISIYENPDR